MLYFRNLLVTKAGREVVLIPQLFTTAVMAMLPKRAMTNVLLLLLLLGRLDRRLLISIAVVGAIVASLLIVGRVSAVSVTFESGQRSFNIAVAKQVDTEPGAPTNVSATAGDGQVTVNWDPPVDDGGSAITSYVVASSPESPSSPLTVGTVPTATVTGLTNGTAYTFTVSAVTAVGTGGQSDPAEEVTPRLAPPATAPGAPTIFVVVSGEGQVTVTWNAPDSNGGSVVTGYVVTSSPNSPNSPLTVGNVTAATVTGLTNGTAYTFTVKAVNDVGTGAPSNQSGAVVPLLNRHPPTHPGAPASVVAVAGHQHAEIDWTVPNRDGGSRITGYIVRSHPDSPNSPMTVDNVLTAKMTELANGSAYAFTVSAFNAVGIGAQSAASDEVTPGGAAITIWAFILIAVGVITVIVPAGFLYLRRTGRKAPALRGIKLAPHTDIAGVNQDSTNKKVQVSIVVPT